MTTSSRKCPDESPYVYRRLNEMFSTWVITCKNVHSYYVKNTLATNKNVYLALCNKGESFKFTAVVDINVPARELNKKYSISVRSEEQEVVLKTSYQTIVRGQR